MCLKPQPRKSAQGRSARAWITWKCHKDFEQPPYIYIYIHIYISAVSGSSRCFLMDSQLRISRNKTSIAKSSIQHHTWMRISTVLHGSLNQWLGSMLSCRWLKTWSQFLARKVVNNPCHLIFYWIVHVWKIPRSLRVWNERKTGCPLQESVSIWKWDSDLQTRHQPGHVHPCARLVRLCVCVEHYAKDRSWLGKGSPNVSHFVSIIYNQVHPIYHYLLPYIIGDIPFIEVGFWLIYDALGQLQNCDRTAVAWHAPTKRLSRPWGSLGTGEIFIGGFEASWILSGWWFGTFPIFHILGIVIPIDFEVVQSSWNHQPAIVSYVLFQHVKTPWTCHKSLIIIAWSPKNRIHVFGGCGKW